MIRKQGEPAAKKAKIPATAKAKKPITVPTRRSARLKVTYTFGFYRTLVHRVIDFQMVQPVKYT
jgi:hypothetical protein